MKVFDGQLKASDPTMVLNVFDETEQEFPEAQEWEAALAVRAGTNKLGFGFFLRDWQGNALASCLMSPEQALAQGQYLVENAVRMMRAVSPEDYCKAVELRVVEGLTKGFENLAKKLEAENAERIKNYVPQGPAD